MSSSLMSALAEFEIAEANLVKLERLWSEISDMLPTGLSFGASEAFEDRDRSFGLVLAALPMIGGWKPDISIPTPNDVAQWRFDAQEAGELGALVWVEDAVDEPGKLIREYRARFVQKRRALIRDALVETIEAIDEDVRALRRLVADLSESDRVPTGAWDLLKAKVQQIEVLLGSSVQHPPTWSTFRRHLRFGLVCDFKDIDAHDWPQSREALRAGLYGDNEPLPQTTADLGDLAASKPRGAVATQLAWSRLKADDFERLLFMLISAEPNYENAEWSMNTNAPDRGRDLAVFRVVKDGLSDILRSRVIVQCKHWLSKSVAATDVAAAVSQMAFWDSPKVDTLIIATTGRFTSDAITWIEKHNDSQRSPRVEPWAESRLELLLAERPWLIAEFGLR